MPLADLPAVAALQALQAGPPLWRKPQNLEVLPTEGGFASGGNFGIRYSLFDILWFLVTIWYSIF
jgi:hypothetical protein